MNWIFGARPNRAARVRLFCFPFAGSGASVYTPWVSQLAPEIAVYPVQLPGRENRLREAPFRRFDELLPALAQVLQPQLNVPYAFFGHSMGALICFELTRYLRQQGLRLPEHLLLSAYRAPDSPPDEPLHALPEQALIKKLLELGGTSPEIMANDELRSLLLPILRADFAVCESYRYQDQAPLDCPITVLGGLQDQRVQRAALEKWQRQTSADFALQMLPGQHLFIRSAQTAVLQLITQTLRSGPSGMGAQASIYESTLKASL